MRLIFVIPKIDDRFVARNMPELLFRFPSAIIAWQIFFSGFEYFGNFGVSDEVRTIAFDAAIS
jgi:hypothetical protein